MKLSIDAELVYSFANSTQIIASVEASHTEDQMILSEGLDVQPPVQLLRDKSSAGDRRIRGSLSGETDDPLPGNGRKQPAAAAPVGGTTASLVGASERCPAVPAAEFAFARPTNSCDLSSANSARQAMALPASWLFWSGSTATSTTFPASAMRKPPPNEPSSTEPAFAGISRISASPCRARFGIPARAVSAYALDLNPPDFHAVFEVYLDGNWWLIDPTRLAPVEGIVRIGSGRDASDIAFLTSDKQCQVLRQTIKVTQAPV